MFKRVIPEILHNSKITYNYSPNSCVYDYNDDIITFNRSKIKKENSINRNIEEYFNRKFYGNDILIISLLHELGHRYRNITKICQPIEKIKEEHKIYNIMFRNKHTKYYYKLITEEREAMNLAIKWFNKYEKLRSKS